MGIFSVGARMASKILPKAVKPAAKKVYRVVKTLPDVILGTSADAFGQGFKAAKGSKFMSRLKSGFRSVEADVAAKSAGGKGFFRRTTSELIHTPRDLWRGLKSGKAAAKVAGKNGILGAVKGFGKAIVKKMPLLGVLAIAGFDGPEVYNAFKEGGFKEGMKELGGVGIELGGMAVGAAIGSCFGPIGTIVGGIVGAIGGSLVRGKTYSERKEEAQQQQLYNDLKALGLSDEEVEYCIENGITVDDVKNAKEEPEEPAQSEKPEVPTEPETPVQQTPVAPVEPEVPTEPETSVQPIPVVPVEPDESTPAQPDQPLNPVQPTPVAPIDPSNPADPTAPVAPAPNLGTSTQQQLTNEQLLMILAVVMQQMQQQLMEHDERIINMILNQPQTSQAPVATTEPVEPVEAPAEPEDSSSSTNPFDPSGDYIEIKIPSNRPARITIEDNDKSNPFNKENLDEEHKIKFAA